MPSLTLQLDLVTHPDKSDTVHAQGINVVIYFLPLIKRRHLHCICAIISITEYSISISLTLDKTLNLIAGYFTHIIIFINRTKNLLGVLCLLNGNMHTNNVKIDR